MMTPMPRLRARSALAVCTFWLLAACSSDQAPSPQPKPVPVTRPEVAQATPKPVAPPVLPPPPVSDAPKAMPSAKVEVASLSPLGMVAPSLPPAAPSSSVAAPVSVPPVATAPVLDPAFVAWREAFKAKAIAAGLSKDLVERELASVQPSEKVVKLDKGQPEFSKPIGTYVQQAATQKRVKEAQTRLAADPRLNEIEPKYGVPVALTASIWAMESDFGRIQGDFDVVNAFATLAFQGRRRDWAETQLIEALKILRDGKITRERLKGSWAGAMGMTQMLPENYNKLGQDFDGDGKVDLWTSAPDALATAAQLLKISGWKAGELWAVEVTLPEGFDYGLVEVEGRPWADWAGLKVTRADGGSFNAQEAAEKMVLLLPAGAKGPAFLALPNHFMIRRYNNSTAYALAVGLMADQIAGRPGLKTPWPVETPLSLTQRQDAQTALKALGFEVGTIDGVIGAGTRKAVRAWQMARGLVSDGYLTADLIARLKAEAAGEFPIAQPGADQKTQAPKVS